MKTKNEKIIKIYKIDMNIDSESYEIDVHNCPESEIIKLAKIGKYGRKDNTEWVTIGAITFFKLH